MARIFMTGFEAATRGMWTALSQNAPVLRTTTARTGLYSLFFENQARGAYRTLPSTYNELFLRIGLRPEGRAGIGQLLFFRLGGTLQVVLCLTSGRQIEVRTSAGVLATGTQVLADGTWYCLEVHVLTDDSAGIVQVKVDGVDDIDLSGADTQSAASPGIDRLQFGGDASLNGAFFYLDDVAVNDTSGAENNGWPGRGGIYLAVAEGAGEYSEFTPSAGGNWECVDEVPSDDDTSYVESDTLGHRDLYTTGGITPVDGTISAVQLCHRAKLADVGIGNLRPLVRHGGVDYVGPDKAVDANYRFIEHILPLAPDGAAWTVADVNALQIGQQVG